MKKLLVSIVVFSFSISVYAQERDSGVFEFAPYVGYTSSFLNGDNVDEFDPLTGVNFGLKIDYYFNDRWSLRSGVTMDPMGAKLMDDEINLNYIHIPVNANWHFGGTRKWNLNFGVSPGFLTKAENGGTDIKNDIESFQIAISYGIGYRIEISENFGILIDGQGIFGISNINKEGDFNNLNAGSSINIGGVFAL